MSLMGLQAVGGVFPRKAPHLGRPSAHRCQTRTQHVAGTSRSLSPRRYDTASCPLQVSSKLQEGPQEYRGSCSPLHGQQVGIGEPRCS